jgi:sugar phosphate isomerase/epimerase
MKLSFWTLGMPPEWTNQDFADNAAKYGYDGIDLRCTRPDENGRPSDLGNLCILSPDVEEIGALFRSRGIAIASMLCYNSGGHGKDGGSWDDFRTEIAKHAAVGQRLGAPRIRVTIPKMPEGETMDSHLEQIGRSVAAALDETPGMKAIFENHVGAASALQLLQMCEKVGDERLGVFFSPDHSIVMQEDSVELCDLYSQYIHQVCFADRKLMLDDLGRFDGQFYYLRYEACGNGEGNVPARKIFDKLKQKGWDGYVSLKWEKSARFGHHLPSGDTELPHFIEFMKSVGVTSAAGATR